MQCLLFHEWCFQNAFRLSIGIGFWVNSFSRSDTRCGTIWWQRSRSALAQVMACSLIAPSHYRNQYWFIIYKEPIYLVQFCGEIKQTNKDFYSQSSKTTYHMISWNIEIAREGLNITNRSEIWQTYLWQCCRDVSWISEWCDDYYMASCGFESFLW